MKYVIEGAHRDTGELMTLTVEAPTRDAAAEHAHQCGIVTSGIRTAADPGIKAGPAEETKRRPRGGIGSMVVVVILVLSSFAFGLWGFSVIAAAESALHEIFAAILWLIAAVLFTGATVTDAIVQLMRCSR